jgi:hypothetical protein
MSSSKTSTDFLELDYAKHVLSSVRTLYSSCFLQYSLSSVRTLYSSCFLQYSLNVSDSRAILEEEGLLNP